jgi:three-Cys-motif partner protein
MDEGRAYRLFCINTEKDDDRCKRLRVALSGFSSKHVFVLCGAFKDRLAEVLELMEDAPSVCFLDPFGVDGISPAELHPLLQRPDTEFLLNLNTRALHRLAGSADSNAPSAKAKVNLVSYVLGDDIRDPIPEWLYERNRLTTREWEEWVVQRYIDHLKGLSRDLVHGLAHAVREKHGGGAKYYLIFASRSKAPFPFMNDFICTEDDDLRLKAELAKRPAGQQAMFEPAHETARQERFRELMNEIHEYGLEHQGCSSSDIIEDFSIVHLGEFMQKHYRHMIDELVAEGRAEIEPAKGVRKEHRRIRFK